jgi:hypothetical protein
MFRPTWPSSCVGYFIIICLKDSLRSRTWPSNFTSLKGCLYLTYQWAGNIKKCCPSIKELHGLSPRANYTHRARPPLSAKLVATSTDSVCQVVSVTDPYDRILGFVDRSRYFLFQVASQLYSRGWVYPVLDPLLLRKSGSAGNRTRTSRSVARNSTEAVDALQYLDISIAPANITSINYKYTNKMPSRPCSEVVPMRNLSAYELSQLTASSNVVLH